jgi:hypothetical protein
LPGFTRAAAVRRAVIVALLGSCALASAAAGRELSREVLARGTGFAAPVDYSEFAPPPAARLPSQQLNGRLTLTQKGTNGFRTGFRNQISSMPVIATPAACRTLILTSCSPALI